MPFYLLAPLSLVRGGNYYYDGGLLRYQVNNGYYYIRRAHASTEGNSLGFSSGHTSLQNNYTRGYGFTLRCLEC